MLKFIKICAEECFDKVLNEEFKKNLMCKMKNVITRIRNKYEIENLHGGFSMDSNGRDYLQVNLSNSSNVVLIYGHTGDELATILKVNDNFIVNVEEGNDEGVTFWVILCTKPLHKVKASFIDNWGSSYEVSDDVVGGLYYHKWGNNDKTYVLLTDSHKIYVYFHLVRVVKFLMPPRNHQVIGNDVICELPEEILQSINDVITSLNVED